MKRLLLLCYAISSYALGADQPMQPPSCPVCHGGYLQGNPSLEAPNLSVLPDWYLRSQLHSFKKNWRSVNSTRSATQDMHAVAAMLSEEDIDHALTFIAAQPKRASASLVTGDEKRGEALYAACTACHGPSGAGNAATHAPPLAGQSDWYLLSQLTGFTAGHRGTHSDDTDGQVMRAAVSAITSEQDALDIVTYINTLNNGDTNP
ncbi:c-type cytochrome [Alteromonas sp. CYL-A6]|uniref:c-type cytochrome n=1 Tax=Alteromonas nitratireducens TaxID=3390813 RepID=UPI0034B03A23